MQKKDSMGMAPALADKLVEKGKEAFLAALQHYNNPMVRFRAEGCAYFLCAAWEAILKAHLINTEGERSIYYKDSDTRTLSLENCLKKVETNKYSPVRMNLERIIDLRNTSTHLVTEEYDAIYVPLFQACVLNFVDKIMDLHGVDVTSFVQEDFLTLSVRISDLDEKVIRAKYSEDVADKLLRTVDNLQTAISENNSRFAIRIQHEHYITKRRADASAVVHISSSTRDGAPVQIIKQLQNPNETHKFPMKGVLEQVNRRLKKAGVDFKATRYTFRLFVKAYDIKEQEAYCFVHKQYRDPQYSYSMKTVDLLTEVVMKDPKNVEAHLKKALENKKS